MSRLPLTEGTTITFDNVYTYTVKNICGYGASCIVYNAVWKESDNIVEHNCIIKECYPYDAEIERNQTNNTLLWIDDNIQKLNIEKFEKHYNKISEFQNENYETPIPLGLHKANNTAYYVTERKNWPTFDKFEFSNLKSLLLSIKALCEEIQKFHNEKMLFLDIKGSNFLVNPNNNTVISLIDVESAENINDINANKLPHLAYSIDSAAPELKSNNYNKINYYTDIYAIGAVLYKKIMGIDYMIDTLELKGINLKSSKYYENLFLNINPLCEKIINEIFCKTLAIYYNKRHKSIDELIEKIDKAIKIAEEKCYIISNSVFPTKNFLGRENELIEIEKCLKCEYSKRAVFLHSDIGGIGKTELAKKYADLHKNEYDKIIFCKYSNSLEETFNKIRIENCETDDKVQHFDMLRKIINNEKFLLIIDNFDVEIDNEPNLEYYIENLKCDKIFTTRIDYDGWNFLSQIDIPELSKDDLRQLFENEWGHITPTDQLPHFDELLNLIGSLTLVVKICAGLIKKNGWSISKLCCQLQQYGLKVLENTDKIYGCKYNTDVFKASVPDILRATFKVSNLSEEELSALVIVYFFSFTQVTRKFYKEVTGSENFAIPNGLVDNGWLKFSKTDSSETDYYELHPVIAELIKLDIKPCEKDFPKAFNFISAKLKPTFSLSEDLPEGIKYLNKGIGDYERSTLLGFRENFFKQIDLTEPSNFKFYIESRYDNFYPFRKIEITKIESNGNEILDNSEFFNDFKGKVFLELLHYWSPPGGSPVFWLGSTNLESIKTNFKKVELSYQANFLSKELFAKIVKKTLIGLIRFMHNSSNNQYKNQSYPHKNLPACEFSEDDIMFFEDFKKYITLVNWDKYEKYVLNYEDIFDMTFMPKDLTKQTDIVKKVRVEEDYKKNIEMLLKNEAHPLEILHCVKTFGQNTKSDFYEDDDWGNIEKLNDFFKYYRIKPIHEDLLEELISTIDVFKIKKLPAFLDSKRYYSMIAYAGLGLEEEFIDAVNAFFDNVSCEKKSDTTENDLALMGVSLSALFEALFHLSNVDFSNVLFGKIMKIINILESEWQSSKHYYPLLFKFIGLASSLASLIDYLETKIENFGEPLKLIDEEFTKEHPVDERDKLILELQEKSKNCISKIIPLLSILGNY